MYLADYLEFRSNPQTIEVQPKLTLNEPQSDLKLVLNDSPQVVEKKTVPEPPVKPSQKRIMIVKDTPK